MSVFFGIAIVMIAFGIMVALVLSGLATLNWSKRCDPKNKAFGRPKSVLQIGFLAKLTGQADTQE
ncbi:hypothetical protein ACFCW2_00015 [Qipengyuania sp. DSG2-2]|uniref:hypothetical protein n=1 Tax=Qipengyuania sp. DGS2-2 TaxID=3349631 RepID=UPI0036D3432D